MTDEARYSIQRISDGAVVQDLRDQTHEQAKGIVTIVWGVVPTTLAEGGKVGEEWKLHMGGVEWVIVSRLR